MEKPSLRPREARLLTLTGTGGVGKTRLAIQVARESANLFPDRGRIRRAGVLETNLTRDPQCRSVAGAEEEVGPTQGPPRLPACEATLARSGQLRASTGSSARGGGFDRVLTATVPHGYEPRNAAGAGRARVLWSHPSSYPAPPIRLLRRRMAGSPAGRLFVERARAVSPAFRLGEGNAAQVATICWQLAGCRSPWSWRRRGLAVLEPVVAPRTPRPSALRQWGTRPSKRQRTLRATLDWSHALLSEPEKALFRRLSVFADGFTLEAVEVVGAAGEVERRLRAGARGKPCGAIPRCIGGWGALLDARASEAVRSGAP